MRTAIVTDSTADLPADLCASRGISVVPLTVTLDGQSYLDGVEISAEQFYQRLSASSGLATTSQPSPGRFVETYGRLLEEHDAVVSIHISARLSGTLASAQQAAAQLETNRIHLVDSEVVSMPLGLLTLAGSALAGEGRPATEVRARLESLRTELRTYFTVATLENLRRGGRIGRASALVGSVLQVKPVLTIRDGEVTPLERVRTLDRALARIAELARAVDQGHGICAVVGHAAAEGTAQRIARELEGITDTLLIQPLGPVVGAHAGAGTVGIGCYPAQALPLGLKVSAAAAQSA
jgi:DegV family protein with EDD domain